MKKKTWEIIFAGVGGQGLVSCGNILGEAASFDDLNAVMTSTYGVETRGTFAKSDLIISDGAIDYPEALHPDVILALAQVAYQKYAPVVSEDTLLIYDQDAITPVESQAKQVGFPIASTARAMGNATSANILSLGIILGKTELMDAECLRKAIRKRFGHNPAAVEKNETMLNAGIQMAHSEPA
nr:2-oxoacid:acceptor oxidoreductase family protein [uncultured Oscillibacter sp.]